MVAKDVVKCGWCDQMIAVGAPHRNLKGDECKGSGKGLQEQARRRYLRDLPVDDKELMRELKFEKRAS
jgi:hypothetical protein